MKIEKQVTLENLGHGAAMEMFQAELRNVVANIVDPNTRAEAVRSVTLKLKLKPSKDRGVCASEITCESKLAAVLPFETNIFVGMENGEAVATEYNSNQMPLPFADVEAALETALAGEDGIQVQFTRVK